MAAICRAARGKRSSASALVVAQEDVGDGHVRDEEPRPVGDGEDAVERVRLRRVRERALEAGVRQLAAADHAVGTDRVVDPEAAAESVGIVVGDLVRHHESPHLKRVHEDVAGAGSRPEDCDRRRARDRDRRPSPPAASCSRLRSGGTTIAAAIASAAPPRTAFRSAGLGRRDGRENRARGREYKKRQGPCTGRGAAAPPLRIRMRRS